MADDGYCGANCREITMQPLRVEGDGAAPCSAWTTWPTHTGQQFVALGKEVWVGSVEVGYTNPEAGTKLTIWKGSAIYTVWSNYPHGFHFQQIAWPSAPDNGPRS